MTNHEPRMNLSLGTFLDDIGGRDTRRCRHTPLPPLERTHGASKQP